MQCLHTFLLHYVMKLTNVCTWFSALTYCCDSTNQWTDYVIHCHCYIRVVCSCCLVFLRSAVVWIIQRYCSYNVLINGNGQIKMNYFNHFSEFELFSSALIIIWSFYLFTKQTIYLKPVIFNLGLDQNSKTINFIA